MLQNYVNKGASKSKLIMGVPFYGQSFSLLSSSESGYGAKSSGRVILYFLFNLNENEMDLL